MRLAPEVQCPGPAAQLGFLGAICLIGNPSAVLRVSKVGRHERWGILIKYHLREQNRASTFICVILLWPDTVINDKLKINLA